MNQVPLQARRRLWVAGTTLTAVAAALATVFLLQSGPAIATPSPAAQATPVSVATVVQSDVAAWNDFSGRLEAVERVDIRSRVAGTVQGVHFREGALVKAGDLLLTIDPAPYQADVDRADAQVFAAQSRFTNTKSNYERSKQLLQDHAISQREYDDSLNANGEADANLRSAQAQLQTARLSLGYTQVRAPVSGRVGKLEITTGNLVAAGPGAPVLTTLVSVSPIYASFDADEQVVTRALRELPAGASARAQIEKIPVQMGTVADTATPIAGHLQLVDNQVDARSGTVRVRAVFDNADGTLMPGQFAHLRMSAVKAEPALMINERAVGTDQNKKFVMVVGPDDKAQYREVTLGANVDGLRIVTTGLKPNERVVVNGLQRVRPGSLIAPQMVAMKTADDIKN
ncbi:MAG: efflux RND transporter periplasmic adaptor subunit [Caulobacter sp.]|nr:efflux RND transporter periplasmic adaptor subunit [Vitreoscilla sp.]